jgi:hypothetical protein
MEHLPLYISAVFTFATVLSVFLFYKASGYLKIVLTALCLWLLLQGGITLSGFYLKTQILPPRFPLLVLPPLLAIIMLFSSPRGKKFTSGLDDSILTLLHTVRIPVEFVLLWLADQKVVPYLMTFEGRNFDIVAGLTSPVIYYYGYIKQRLGRGVILTWNILCLLLLFNIVINAILSLPTPFQQFAFDQPNVAVLYFPYSWLPCLIVPLVLYAHLVCIQRLISGNIIKPY